MTGGSPSIGIEKVGIADILLRWSLAVPLNQRPYKWEEEEVEKLFQDLTKAFDKQPLYFLGTVMFTYKNYGDFEVADGQQRLATISILIAAIRDYLIELGDKSGADAYQSDYLIKYDPPSGAYKPRLTLNTQDDSYFYQSVLLPEAERAATAAAFTSNVRIAHAAQLAAAHVRAVTAKASNPDKLQILYEWIEHLKTTALVIMVTVPASVGNSFKMFETLNARGVPASEVDILKNYLFDKAPSQAAKIHSSWLSMLSTIESYGSDSLVLTYIRHLWVSLHGPTTIDELGSEFERVITNERKAVDFAGQLDECASDYVALLAPLQSPRWDGLSSTARKALDIISNEFGGEQIRPLMLAVARNFDKQEMEKSFKIFLSWSVRFLISGGGGGGKLDRYYGLTAHEVTEGNIKTTAALITSMQDVIPSDRKFQEEFSRASVKRINLARYYLRAIETFRAADPAPQFLINEDPNAVNLEHVLPVTPSADWKIDAETAGVFHKRLGNMVLLGSKLNVALGNKGFPAKRVELAKSQLSTTREVADETDWGPDQIKARQLKMAEDAPKVWPLK